MNAQTTYFLIRIDHPENVDGDRLSASMEGGQNVIQIQVLQHSDTLPKQAVDHDDPCPYISFD